MPPLIPLHSTTALISAGQQLYRLPLAFTNDAHTWKSTTEVIKNVQMLFDESEQAYTVAPDDAAELDEWVSKLQGEGVSVAGTPKPKRSKRHKGGAPVAAPGGRGRSRQA